MIYERTAPLLVKLLQHNNDEIVGLTCFLLRNLARNNKRADQLIQKFDIIVPASVLLQAKSKEIQKGVLNLLTNLSIKRGLKIFFPPVFISSNIVLFGLKRLCQRLSVERCSFETDKENDGDERASSKLCMLAQLYSKEYRGDTEALEAWVPSLVHSNPS